MISFEYQSGIMHLREDGSIGAHVSRGDLSGGQYKTVIIHTNVGHFQTKVKSGDVEDLLRKVGGDVKVKEEDTDTWLHDSSFGQILEDDEPQEVA